MPLDLMSLLETLGSAVALVLAAWVFKILLHQRYRSLRSSYRPLLRMRRGYYQLLRRALGAAMLSSILLFNTLVFVRMQLLFADMGAWRHISGLYAPAGLFIVLIGTALVFEENLLAQQGVDAEDAGPGDHTG